MVDDIKLLINVMLGRKIFNKLSINWHRKTGVDNYKKTM